MRVESLGRSALQMPGRTEVARPPVQFSGGMNGMSATLGRAALLSGSTGFFGGTTVAATESGGGTTHPDVKFLGSSCGLSHAVSVFACQRVQSSWKADSQQLQVHARMPICVISLDQRHRQRTAK